MYTVLRDQPPTPPPKWWYMIFFPFYTDIGIEWKSPSDGQGHSPRHATPTPSAWAWPKSVRFKIHENNWWVWLPLIWYKIQLVSISFLSPHLALVGISLPIDPTMWLVLSEQFTLFENLNILQADWNLHCAHRLPLRGLVDECIPAAFLIINIFLLSSSDFPHHLVALEGRRIVFPILVKDWALYTCAQLIAPSTNWSWR